MVSHSKVDELVAEFRRTGFFDLADKYESPVTDEPSLIISITLDRETKTVEGEGHRAPQPLVELGQKIDEAVNSSQWVGNDY